MALTLLPIDGFDEKIHRLIYERISSEKVFKKKVDEKSELFLEFSESDKFYRLLRDLRGLRKSTVAWFAQSVMHTCVNFVVRNRNKFDQAGFDVFWKCTEDGKLKVKFCLNLQKIAFEDDELAAKLSELFHHRMAPFINHFFDQKPYPPELYDVEDEEEEEEDPDEAPDDDPSNNVRIFVEVEKATKNWRPSKNHSVIENPQSCKLLSYQRRTVQWMIQREKEPEIESLCKFIECVEVSPPKGITYPQPLYYYPSFGLFSESNSLFNGFEKPKGGILADESGLGKTVQIVSLISSHKKEVQKPQKCSKCEERCDSRWEKESKFYCSHCVPPDILLHVKTTLIIAPESLMNHWRNELMKHYLEVQVYHGMKNKYLDLEKIACSDVVLTSYEVFKTEIEFTSEKCSEREDKTNRFRKNSRKTLRSSLTEVKWWRLVCDEIQVIKKPELVESQTMCQILNAEYRWVVTDTPFEDEIRDVSALYKFIQLWPFNIKTFWKIVVMGFHDLCDNQRDLSKSLLIQLTSQIMRRTKKITVLGEMDMQGVKEIDRVVEFLPIEDFNYRRRLENYKEQVELIIGDAQNDDPLWSLERHETLFELIGILKETFISGREHDQDAKLDTITEEINSEPKNCMIRQINNKRQEIEKTLTSTIQFLLNASEIHYLDSYADSAKGYAKIFNVLEIVDEVNGYCEQLKDLEDEEIFDDESEQDIEDDDDDDDKLQTLNRKRKLSRRGDPENVKMLKLKNLVDKDRLAAENMVRRDLLEFRKKVAQPYLFDLGLTMRFIPNMVEVHRMMGTNPVLDKVIDKMGGMEKLMDNLCLTIERFSKREREKFRGVKGKGQKIFDEWYGIENKHIGLRDLFMEVGGACKKSIMASEPTMSIELMCSDEAEAMLMDMSFWPIFKDSQKHFEEGESSICIPECTGACTFHGFKDIPVGHQLSRNHELLQNVVDYMNKLGRLRSEVFNNYSAMISYFQKKYTETFTLTQIRVHSNTILCKHEKCVDHIIINEDDRKTAQNAILCLICATKFSLAHLNFEIGIGNYHGVEKQVRGKLPIEKFLAKLVAMAKRRQPKTEMAEEFRDFSHYIERLRRAIIHIQSGINKTQAYSDSLQKLLTQKKRITMVDLRTMLKDSGNKSDEALRKECINHYMYKFNSGKMDLKKFCGDFRYLISLYKQIGSDDDVDRCCPICMEDWLDTNGFVGFPCGHRICQSCYREFRNRKYSTARPKSTKMKCSTCRYEFQHENVVFGRENIAQTSELNELIPGVRLTAKLAESIQLIREILKSSEENMIVLYTSTGMGTSMWEYLVDVFREAKLPFYDGSEALIRGSPFEFSKKRRLFLCSTSQDLIGLDFSHSSHVIFLDPPESYSAMQKAIGRVIRYGQKHLVKIYYIIVGWSLDADIFRVCRGKNSKWLVGDIRNIFGIPFNIRSNDDDDDNDDDNEAAFIELVRH